MAQKLRINIDMPESERHFIIWEYDSLADSKNPQKRRGDYKGPYVEFKKNDPYYMGVFDHSSMRIEVWKEIDRNLWIEQTAESYFGWASICSIISSG